MPLRTILPQLKLARENHWAIPLFDTFDMFSTEGMIRAAEERKTAIIVALYSSVMVQPNVEAFAAYVRKRIEISKLPIAFMLDHGQDVNQCIRAISFGCTDVMFDGSKLPIEDNMAATREVVQVAHARGVSVEAELGHVGLGTEYEDVGGRRAAYTDPDAVQNFVEQTGIDSLAVAFGTAHGQYRGEPDLDLGLLADIRSRVSIPLVMHGGSGLSEGQFRQAIAAGVSKINVATDLYATTGRRLRELAGEETSSYFAVTGGATKSFQERCGYYIDLFKSAAPSTLR